MKYVRGRQDPYSGVLGKKPNEVKSGDALTDNFVHLELLEAHEADKISSKNCTPTVAMHHTFVRLYSQGVPESDKILLIDYIPTMALLWSLIWRGVRGDDRARNSRPRDAVPCEIRGGVLTYTVQTGGHLCSMNVPPW